MAKTVNASGTGTLPVSGPGVQSTVTVTDANVLAADKVMLTETKRVRDSEGAFHAYVSSAGAGTFIVASSRDQLPETLTFNYISVT